MHLTRTKFEISLCAITRTCPPKFEVVFAGEGPGAAQR